MITALRIYGILLQKMIQLTRRETQIAERIAWGSSLKEVASDLNISKFTVDNILRKIYEKTGVNKINELSAWWFCTHFGISFDLSPLKRKIGALAMLALFLYGESNMNNDFCRLRTRRTNRTESIRIKS